jgi:L-histidine N-alpha-methyltransferase
MTTYTVLGSAREEERLIGEFAADVARGLAAEPKSLPCKYIYDERGSGLFSRIMDLDVYYLTHCETEILETCKDSICERAWSRGLNVVELGAGDGKKTKILLGHLIERRLGFNYVPIDISESAVRDLTRDLRTSMPEMETHGLVAEYMSGIRWLSSNNQGGNLVLFLGSSIGNFSPAGARRFLRSLRESMGGDDRLLMGFDLVKDVRVMESAYDDPEGVTALFNLNMLERINRELDGRFDIGAFRFRSGWDPESMAIQSCLVSTGEQDVRIEGLDLTARFARGEAIHTESSYKFTVEAVEDLAAASGFEPVEFYFDSRAYFLDALLKPLP